jgi:large subunit ribosomal protein L35
MPKIKTKRAAAKRFSFTGTGKIKHPRANKQKLNGHKNAKRLRRLRHPGMVDSTNEKQMRRLMPYS